MAGAQPRTQVTQYLFVESRCQCVLPDRALPAAIRLRPELALLDKERGQDLKFVLPTGDESFLSERLQVNQGDKSVHDLAKIQANLPSRYEVSGFFGQGGMGAVFKAYDHDENRAVAIKVMRPQLVNDPGAIKRFQHEAKSASSLSHPNIAAVYDYGIGAEGAPYIVMELVEGESLERLVNREGPLKTKRTLAIGLQIARALEAAHERDIVHRDVKPSNIIISKTGNAEIAKLTDFGIAKSLLPDSSQSITQTGLMIGSPMYMSPEQCEGKKFDHRSDIYSLGCVLYKCLCGETPFDSDSALKVLLQHIEEQPAPICSKVADHLSDDLNYIVMSCLDKKIDYRYSSARELAEDLEKRLAGKKILFHSHQDYSPVHLNPVSVWSDEDAPTAVFSKKGWQTGKRFDAGNQTGFYIAIVLLLAAGIPLIGSTIYLFSEKHAAAKEVSSMSRLMDSSSGYLPASDIVEHRKSLKDVVLYFTANAQSFLLKGNYEQAAKQFAQLVEISKVQNDRKFEADNLFYLAHCQVALKKIDLARENYARAIDLYKTLDVADSASLLPRAIKEAQALAVKNE